MIRNRDTIRSRIRRKLASFYSALAEKLPTFHGSIIATLQDIRRDQRKEATDALQRSKPPEGSGIKYSHLRLFEFFPIEDYERMEDGLRRLFPEGRFGKEVVGDFKETATTLTQSGWWYIGYLFPKPGEFFAPTPNRVLETLPEEVKGIRVSLQKILPSAFAVSLDVALAPSVSERLKSIQSQPFLPEVIFRRWVPWGPAAGGWSKSAAETASQRAVLESLSQLRGRIEHVVLPFVSGYFSAEHRGQSPRLPAIEIFTLEGVPTDDDAFKTWLSGTRLTFDHLWTLGADRMELEFYGFRKPGVIFSPALVNSYNRSSPYEVTR